MASLRISGISGVFFWPCCLACRILVPRPRIEPRPRQWKPRILTIRPPGNSQWHLNFYELYTYFPFLYTHAYTYMNITLSYLQDCSDWEDFPGGAVVKNPPANAGDTGSSPGPGRSHMPRSNEAHAPQLLSLHSRACEPQLLSPCATTTEAHMPRARAP